MAMTRRDFINKFISPVKSGNSDSSFSIPIGSLKDLPPDTVKFYSEHSFVVLSGASGIAVLRRDDLYDDLYKDGWKSFKVTMTTTGELFVNINEVCNVNNVFSPMINEMKYIEKMEESLWKIAQEQIIIAGDL